MISLNQIITSMRAIESLSLTRRMFIEDRADSIQDYYTFDKVLGHGGFATVWQVSSKQNQNLKRAVKIISKSRMQKCPYLQSQFEILTKLDHPTIIKIYETFQDDSNFYIVLDLCKGGDLLEYLTRPHNISQFMIRSIFLQMVQTVQYCHTNKVAHRDLKPENFLILGENILNIKLIDFGMAFQWKQNMEEQLKKIHRQKALGTVYYVAPQILTNDSYDSRCDIWSLGVILYVMSTGYYPFTGNTKKQIIDAVKKREYNQQSKEFKKISFHLRDLINKMLKPVQQRILLEQILQHPWVKKENVPRQKLKLNFGRMRHFKKYSKLKKISLSCISSQLSELEIEKLGQQFKELDTNFDGYLEIEQFQQSLQKSNPNISLKQIESTIKGIDLDCDGKINYLQFITSCIENHLIFKKENIIKAFRILDKNNDGNVSAEELRHLLLKQTDFNSHINQQEVQEIIRASDKNNDGFIDYHEFQRALGER